jgi:hypothetical protein
MVDCVYHSSEMALHISLAASFNNVQDWKGVWNKAGEVTIQKLV